jgi:hypothetical protein
MLTLANIASAIQDAFRHRVEIWRTPPAAAAGDEAGTGADFHRWRSECDALIFEIVWSRRRVELSHLSTAARQ